MTSSIATAATMQWASALSSLPSLYKALDDCVSQIQAQLEGRSADLVIAFISPGFTGNFQWVAPFLAERLPSGIFLGCTGGGIIGGGQEVESMPSLALIAASLPGVDLYPFHISPRDIPDLDSRPDRWVQALRIPEDIQPDFILLSDGQRITDLLQGMDFAFPHRTKIGGLVSGARYLFGQEKIYSEGSVGVGFAGNIVLDTVVAQGCRPIGPPFKITQSERHLLYALEDQPVIEVLREVLSELNDRDRELARHSLSVGILSGEVGGSLLNVGVNEAKETAEEIATGTFLIRNLMGISAEGAIAIGARLRPGQMIQFHIRDGRTSAEDIHLLLSRYHAENGQQARGALLFSCLGRGEQLYGVPDHDLNCIHRYLGPIPVGGFFCNGEIGPVGSETYLHGFTSVVGLFRPKSGGDDL
jgi:small ligand-binding sensory domain FIST